MGHQQLAVSYLTVRRAIGVIAILHPAILYFGACVIFGVGLQNSMSDYYYTPMRDVFVGVDVCTGVFLLCYRGYGLHDRIVSILAGVSAILVALFPTAGEGVLSEAQQHASVVHSVAALIFLASLAYFCLVLFVRSDNAGVLSPRKRMRNRIYRICGFSILAVLLSVLLYGAVPALNSRFNGTPFIFYLELIAFVSFGVSWLVKGHAILSDLDGQGQPC